MFLVATQMSTYDGNTDSHPQEARSPGLGIAGPGDRGSIFLEIHRPCDTVINTTLQMRQWDQRG